jgi:hypothetical protein
MRTTVPIALAAALAVAIAPAQASAAAKQPAKCEAKRSHTLLKTKAARVYELKNGTVYGCLLKKNKRVVLGVRGDCQGSPEPRAFRLGGRYVGFVSTACNLDAADETVIVVDLRTGRARWTAPAFKPPSGLPAQQRDPNTGVTSFVMTDRGSAAWIGIYDAAGERSLTKIDDPADQVQVRKLEPGVPAGGTTVDEGQDVGLRSLRLRTDGFSYRKGAMTLVAPLR